MIILHVITSLKTGGAEKLLVDLLPKLKESGNEIRLALFNGERTPFYEQLEAAGIKIYPIQVGDKYYDPSYIGALKKLMKGVDIVHTHNTSPQLFAAIAAAMMGKKERPALVTTEHSTSNRRRSMPLLKPLDQWMYRQYAKVICISQKAEDNLKGYLGTDERLCTIFNGIDISKFLNEDAHAGAEPGKEVMVTMVAGFKAPKDQNTLIKAIAALPERYHVQFVGGGESVRMEDSRHLAEELGVAARVHFLGMRTDVPQLLQSSDIQVLASHYEGLSLSSLECMASGKPFIASDVDGLHETVEGYGILFPDGDAQALAAEIKKLAEEPDYARQVAGKCMERAKQFDISVMADNYLKVYNSICCK